MGCEYSSISRIVISTRNHRTRKKQSMHSVRTWTHTRVHSTVSYQSVIRQRSRTVPWSTTFRSEGQTPCGESDKSRRTTNTSILVRQPKPTKLLYVSSRDAKDRFSSSWDKPFAVISLVFMTRTIFPAFFSCCCKCTAFRGP